MLLFIYSSEMFSQKTTDEILIFADEMPRFPGCENMQSQISKTNCTDQKLMEYIYSNLKYSPEATMNEIEGTVLVSFVINENGNVINVTIEKDIGEGCGKAVKKVIEKMNKMEKLWKPGIYNGNPVKVLLTYPIEFRLHG